MTDLRAAAGGVVAGQIVRLDSDRLRALGGSLTNAQETADEDRAVTGVHDFLVLSVDERTQLLQALPLFPRSAPGSAPLNDLFRVGPTDWLAEPVFYSRWQHWQIPISALPDAEVASEDRSYASGNADALRDLGNWATRNRCAFRSASKNNAALSGGERQGAGRSSTILTACPLLNS